MSEFERRLLYNKEIWTPEEAIKAAYLSSEDARYTKAIVIFERIEDDSAYYDFFASEMKILEQYGLAEMLIQRIREESKK